MTKTKNDKPTWCHHDDLSLVSISPQPFPCFMFNHHKDSPCFLLVRIEVWTIVAFINVIDIVATANGLVIATPQFCHGCCFLGFFFVHHEIKYCSIVWNFTGKTKHMNSRLVTVAFLWLIGSTRSPEPTNGKSSWCWRLNPGRGFPSQIRIYVRRVSKIGDISGWLYWSGSWSRVRSYPPGNEHIPQKWHFEDDFSYSQGGIC